MELFPAIDLRDGHCVRLLRGDFDAETVYDDDPVRVARQFADAGAQWIHIVDLDAARTGTPHQRELIAAMCAAVPGVGVQVGGGVRDADAAAALLDAGVTRVVVGTAAVEHPGLVADLAAAHPGRICVGLDARGREVAVRGWVEGSGADLVEMARTVAAAGAAALIVTEIGRDGTLQGPDLDQLGLVLGEVDVPVVASGGVGVLDDLRALAALEVGGRKLHGAIVGRAIYEGRFDVAGALGMLAQIG